jgi:hypothetical protein
MLGANSSKEIWSQICSRLGEKTRQSLLTTGVGWTTFCESQLGREDIDYATGPLRFPASASLITILGSNVSASHQNSDRELQNYKDKER